MKVSQIQTLMILLIYLGMAECEAYGGNPQDEGGKITVETVSSKAVTITQRYACQIHARRHIGVQALAEGYVEPITIKEGQTVKAGDRLFQIAPVVYKAKLAAEVAERDLAQQELNNATTNADKVVISQKEVLLYKAKLAKAQAKVDLAQAKLNFTTVKAPFDGIIGGLKEQQGSWVEEGDLLTTLSDTKVVWVFFNVPEKRYLEYMADPNRDKQPPEFELILSDHTRFPQTGKLGAIDARFDPQTGLIAFRADFPNPEGLLRHGQSGTLVMSRVLKDAIVIPQWATFEKLAKRYVYVVDQDNVAHEREIVIRNELDHLFVIKKGIGVGDKIVVDGVRLVHDGEKLK